MPTTTTEPRQYAPRTDARPSGKQIYAMAFALLEIAGIPEPRTRADASRILEQLMAQREAVRQERAEERASAEAPF